LGTKSDCINTMLLKRYHVAFSNNSSGHTNQTVGTRDMLLREATYTQRLADAKLAIIRLGLGNEANIDILSIQDMELPAQEFED
jgi:hypothetical protein